MLGAPLGAGGCGGSGAGGGGPGVGGSGGSDDDTPQVVPAWCSGLPGPDFMWQLGLAVFAVEANSHAAQPVAAAQAAQHLGR